MRLKLIKGAMKDWRTLNEHVATFTAEEALHALNQELKKDVPREMLVERLKQRYVAAKAEAARKEVG